MEQTLICVLTLCVSLLRVWCSVTGFCRSRLTRAMASCDHSLSRNLRSDAVRSHPSHPFDSPL